MVLTVFFLWLLKLALQSSFLALVNCFVSFLQLWSYIFTEKCTYSTCAKNLYLSQYSNFCCVALTSILFKVFESVLIGKIYKHLYYFKLIFDWQYAFVRNVHCLSPFSYLWSLVFCSSAFRRKKYWKRSYMPDTNLPFLNFPLTVSILFSVVSLISFQNVL